MSKTGISHPNILDLVTLGEKIVSLVVVEKATLSDEDAPALQDKLNNYLEYALEGELVRHYPEASAKQVVVRIDLYARPSAYIQAFIGQYKEAVAKYGVRVELSIEDEVSQ